MALAESAMLPLKTALPAFELTDVVDGKIWSAQDLSGKPCLLMVICNHCPYVKRVKAGLVRLADDLSERGVTVLAVNANDPAAQPGDSPEKMADDAREFGYPFPYLFDAEQALARALQAVATPEFYLFDASGLLVYRGQMDRARPNNQEPNDGHSVLEAVSALEQGRDPIDPQFPSIGCSIKWRESKQA